jgi:tetratricopeptide (TPR) repeat protein
MHLPLSDLARPRAQRACVALRTLGCSLLTACSTLPSPFSGWPALLHDEYYPRALAPPDRDAVFALSPAMRAYADTVLGSAERLRDPRVTLLDALYRQDQLRLHYDAGPTRNAAQAFQARAGNCLSLVIMTAAFARHLGVPVSYQSVQGDDIATRSGSLVLVSHHINLVLGRRRPQTLLGGGQNDDMTVDFLPGEQLRGQRTRPLDERTVLAMYFNNRAAEALAEGRPDEPYAWAREAVRQDPAFMPAYNTLAVIYLRDGHLALADAALQHVLVQAPLNTSALSNLALLLERQGQPAQAEAVRLRLGRLHPAAAPKVQDPSRPEPHRVGPDG